MEFCRLRTMKSWLLAPILLVVVAVAGLAGVAGAATVEVFLRADTATVTMPDGTMVPMWGFAQDSSFGAGDGTVTVPGPVIEVPPGDDLLIHLDNNLPEPVSIVIPGQITTMTPVYNNGRVRSFTHETPPGNGAPVDYAWTTLEPGTYLYHSGSHPQVQVQMGLYGALKHDDNTNQVYNVAFDTTYDNEIVMFFSEIDPALHTAVSTGTYGTVGGPTSTINFEPKYFLLNGQPYDPSVGTPIPAGMAGETTLLRFINGGVEDYIPMLPNGMYMSLIAEDGKPYPAPREQYTILLAAGKTVDALLNLDAAGTHALYDRRLHLTNSASSPGGMIAQLEVLHSTQDIFDLVVHYYNTILGRAPEPGGAEFWRDEIQRIIALGIDIREGYIALGKVFFSSGEYLAKSTSDTQYVIDLYAAFLNRAPDGPGQAFWEAQVAAVGRDVVFNSFGFSVEFGLFLDGIFGPGLTRAENNMVNDFYRGILARLPDNVGYNDWLAQMRASQCVGAQAVRDFTAQISLAFVQSAEYGLRARNDVQFVEDLYNAFLRRGATQAEFDGWVSQLGTGMTRAALVTAFVNSVEFQARVQAVIDEGCMP